MSLQRNKHRVGESVWFYLFSMLIPVLWFSLGCTISYFCLTESIILDELLGSIVSMPLCYLLFTFSLFYWKTIFLGIIILAHYIYFSKYLNDKKKKGCLRVSNVMNFIMGCIWSVIFRAVMGI